jgi:hypothetical protein
MDRCSELVVGEQVEVEHEMCGTPRLRCAEDAKATQWGGA